VALSDHFAKYIPSTVNVPQLLGKQITLVDLTTHTSGLPRDTSDRDPRNPQNPDADYSLTQLYDFISGFHLTREIGSQYRYSNVASALATLLRASRSRQRDISCSTHYKSVIDD
jgi:CubicO group peptidase (beta-lactamase class C family)